MARLPDALIERIKADISLLRLAESQSYQPKQQGKDYALNCPFHPDDDTPSLIISPKSNLYHCFGCGAAGSVIDWVMKTQGVSFRFACELLQKDIGRIAGGGTKAVKANTTTKLAAPLTAEADHQTALCQVIDYYHETLKQAPEALAYLEARGLHHSELIERFKLGFANRTLGYRLPEKQYKAGKALRGKLQAIGLLRSSGHEHFNGSLVVPVIDERGLITEVYGRKVTPKLRPGTAKHLYLPGPHDGVWNVEALQASQEVILCEALIDAMTFWVHGFRNVTASYGTAGFTAAHLAAFKQHGIQRVLIAYDRDEAGNKAAEQLAKTLQGEGIDCFRILLPKGMDINDYALQVTPAQKSLGLVIRKAEWIPNTLPPVAGQALGDVQGSTSVTGGRKPGVTSGKPPERQLDLETVVGSLVDTQTGEVLEEAPPAAATATLPEPAATVQPPAPAVVEAETTDHETVITLGGRDAAPRRYRIRGLSKNLSYDQLKINVLVSKGETFHIDNLDIYSARHRAAYIKQASAELSVSEEVLKKDLGQVLLKLEVLQEQQINNTLSPQPDTVTLSAQEKKAALNLLQDPALLSRILEGFTAIGVVGEETNKLVGYLAGVSRKLDKPLAVIIQSSSAAGKSSLMDAVLTLMPEEERVQYSAMTGQSLFYMGETNLKHKILAIAEEEGAEQASYALKLLQSEGEVTIASTGKDDTTGNLVTKEYKVEGPVMLFLTTTAIDIDEELLNRCLVLTVNENREQTEAIHAQQRFEETLEGLLASETKKDLIALHRNAQRLLKPLKVVNPYADQLTFLHDKTRTRRDHKKYLTLIRTIALLHQYQRPVQRVTRGEETLDYIEVTLSDIDTANRLAHEVLGRTLDELPPQTRKLLQIIRQRVIEHCQAEGIAQNDYRFTRKDVRAVSGWGNTQLKLHMSRLEEMEYLLVHRSGRGNAFEYELLYDGDLSEDHARMMGLIDPHTLRYDEKRSGANVEKPGVSRPPVGAVSGIGRGDQKPLDSTAHKDLAAEATSNDENARSAIKNKGDRNPTDTIPVAAVEP